MNTTKLLKLADFLDTVPKELFNIQFVHENFNWENDEFKKQWLSKDVDCGATGCAIGWLPVALPDDAYYDDLGRVMLKNDDTWYDFDIKAMKVFKISREISDYLFSPGSYIAINWNNPKAVANRIRNLVQEELDYAKSS